MHYSLARRLTAVALAVLTLLPLYAQKLNNHPWKGKRVAYLGDSITDPNNDGSDKKYWNFLEDWLDIKPFVYGVSGRQWNNIPAQADKLEKDHGNDFDAIMIFIGTNDYNDGLPLGRWWNEQEEEVEEARGHDARMSVRLRRTPAMNRNTYRGCINIALANLKHRWPEKQIVLLTPIHRAYFNGGPRNIQPSEEYQNKAGEYVDAYIGAVREAGRIWSMPVVDLHALSGLFPLFDESSSAYFHSNERDRLHPNDAGHRRMALTLYYQLGALPCTF